MSVPEISPNTVNEKQTDYVIIDVRGEDEYNAELGHINDSKLVTLGENLTNWLNENKDSHKNKEIVFVCRSGGRSGRATEEALGLGYTEVYNMTGGMIYWNELNLPTSSK